MEDHDPPPQVSQSQTQISDPLLSPTKSATFSSSSDLCPSLSSLTSLSFNGQFQSLLSLISQTRSQSTLLSKPHEHLVFLTLNSLSLFKLHNFSSSLLEIHSLNPPFDDPKYCYETYPDVYPNLSGSMIPFAVRFLHALIPEKLGDRKETVDRLYLLLDFVRCKGDDDGGVWRRREVFLLCAICNNHFAHKEFDVCFQLVDEILKMDVMDPDLLSRLGYLQLQIGDMGGAKETFKKVENMECEDVNLNGRNRALVFLVEKDYVSAVREYDECIERDGGDVVALNNKALCLMYLRDLSDAIKLLEGALERVPNVAVNETIVVNLCSMYELAYVSYGDVKKSLSNWIARVAPDDFDSSCTRI